MIHFVVHDEGDSVGVVVVEGVKAGQTPDRLDHGPGQGDHVQGRASDIPIGHKLAIKALQARTRR